jgi:hypothetical protein
VTVTGTQGILTPAIQNAKRKIQKGV